VDLAEPYEESRRYRDFMGWDMPWYSAQPSLEELLVGRRIGTMHLVSYLRDGDRVFETYRTSRRGVEVVDYRRAPHRAVVAPGRRPLGRPHRWAPRGTRRASVTLPGRRDAGRSTGEPEEELPMVSVETVRGPVDVESLGVTLMHEHVTTMLVDNPRPYFTPAGG
jgi:hypothetical protein